MSQVPSKETFLAMPTDEFIPWLMISFIPEDRVECEATLRDSLISLTAAHGLKWGVSIGPNEGVKAANLHLAACHFMLEFMEVIVPFSKNPKVKGELEANPAFPESKPEAHLGYSGVGQIFF